MLASLLTSHPLPALKRVQAEPIINYGTGWKMRQVEEPIIFVGLDEPGYAVMFFSGVGDDGKVDIGRATFPVTDPTQITEYAGNPVGFDDGEGNYNYRLDSILLDPDGTLYAYATHVDLNRIDLYKSTDKGFVWTFVATVLTGSGQGRDDEIVGQAASWREGGVTTLIYGYRDTPNGVLKGLRYATANDYQTFTKAADGDILHVVPGTTYSTYIEWHHLSKIGDVFVMTMECYDGTTWRNHQATSLSLTSGWIVSPITFPPSGLLGSFDLYHVATPANFLLGGKWYQFYQGGGQSGNYANNNWAMGVAEFTMGSTPLDFCYTPTP